MESIKSSIDTVNGNASVDAEGNLVGFSFGPEVVEEEVELLATA
jgi:hypothetical protein